jgi:ribosomal protein S18 acetylase RimI-like enzyme
MRIREAKLRDAAAMARVIVDSYRSAHRDQIPEKSLMKFTYKGSERAWIRALREISASAEYKECIFVAENDAGELIGVAMGGPEGSKHPLYTGEIYALYLLPAYQRQGSGRQLTVSVVKRLVEMGLDSLLIRVLKANAPARRFYEALGGQLVPDVEEQFEERGAMLVRIAYGWRDVSELLRPR